MPKRRRRAISGELATVASVAGAISGAVGILVGVLSTPSVAVAATRFSDIGVFATLFTSCGMFVGVVIAAASSRIRGAPAGEDPAGEVTAPAGDSASTGAATVQQRPPAALPGRSRPTRPSELRKLAEAAVPEQELLPFAWDATGAHENPGPAAGLVAPETVNRPESDAADVALFLLNLPASRLLVLGGPGAGKTILARWLAAELAKPDRGTSPGYVSLADWRPREESFSRWMSRLTSDDTGNDQLDGPSCGQALMLLDDFDTLSRSARLEVLAALRGTAEETPLFVLFSRPEEYEEVAPPAGWVAKITLRPLPPSVIECALHPLVAESNRWILDQLRDRVSASPQGPLAAALSSPVMLSRARRAFLLGNRAQSILAAQTREEIEELLIADVVPQTLFHGGHWPAGRVTRWLHEIAERSTWPYSFRPNEPDADDLAGSLLILPFLAVGGAAAWFASRIVADTIHASTLLFVLLLVVHAAGFLALGITTEDPEPDHDPREDMRTALRDLLGRMAAAVGALLVGLLGLLAAHSGIGAVMAAVCLGAIAGFLGSDRAGLRVAGLLGGAVFGGIVGVAADAATHTPPSNAFLSCALLIAVPVFAVGFAACVVDYLSHGESFLYIPFGLVLSAVIASLAGVVGACLLVLGAHAGTGGSPASFAGPLHLLAYVSLWAVVLMLTSEAVARAGLRLVLAVRGVIPVPLFAFIDDCIAGGVIRRRGYSYEFKYPALRRVCLKWSREEDWR